MRLPYIRSLEVAESESSMARLTTFPQPELVDMNHLFFVRSICVAFLLLIVCSPCLAQSIFPDKALEEAVRKEVFAKRYNKEPITKDDVRNISQVHAKGKEIKDLTGLEHCVAVQEIDLENNNIKDVSQLAGLKLLQSINLAGNEIEDIGPLAELERVQYLELSRNDVTDVSALQKMTNMRSLYLSENTIEDIKVVENLPKVWTLYLADNPVKDFTPVGSLKWLSSCDLRDCRIKDLSFLKPLTELKYLNLKENRLRDLGVLVEMAKGDKGQRFAPFWRIYLKGNPMGGKTEEQLATLRDIGARIHLDK